MASTVEVKGNGPLDTATRKECLEALSKNAETWELQKLKNAMNDPNLRGMLKMIP